jgi:SsrA-binding protein
MAADQKSGEKLIATNPNAHANYFIEEVVEAGIVLTGTEAKSLRNQSPNLKDSYVEVTSTGKKFEAWLLNTHIGPYSHGNIWNHVATRRRKLLLHHYQLERLHGAVIQKGMTIVPVKMYFKKGLAKIEIGVGKGKKKHDKREDIKRRTAEREMEVEMSRR